MNLYDRYGNPVGIIQIETDEELALRCKLDAIKGKLLGLAGVLETPTGLGTTDEYKILEYERRCQQVSSELRELNELYKTE